MLGGTLGDAIGEIVLNNFFIDKEILIKIVESREKLKYTDDTSMAFSILKSLVKNNSIDLDDISNNFVNDFLKEPDRGYAGGPIRIFTNVLEHKMQYISVEMLILRAQLRDLLLKHIINIFLLIY